MYVLGKLQCWQQAAVDNELTYRRHVNTTWRRQYATHTNTERPSRGVDHALPSNTGVKEKVELYV